MSIEGTETETDWWQVFMVQDNATVATPSALGNDSFSVAYTGTQNTIAKAAGSGGSALQLGRQPRNKIMSQRISER
jgi:hypothetical protein